MATATQTKTKADIATEVAAVLTGDVGPLGPAIDRLFTIREKKRLLDAEASKLEAEYHVLEEQVMDKLEREGSSKAAGKKAGVSITSGIVANVTDWDAFEKFVKKTGYFHLFQRRVSEPAFREVLEKKGAVPGATPFTKKKLNLRVI